MPYNKLERPNKYNALWMFQSIRFTAYFAQRPETMPPSCIVSSLVHLGNAIISPTPKHTGLFDGNNYRSVTRKLALSNPRNYHYRLTAYAYKCEEFLNHNQNGFQMNNSVRNLLALALRPYSTVSRKQKNHLICHDNSKALDRMWRGNLSRWMWFRFYLERPTHNEPNK